MKISLNDIDALVFDFDGVLTNNLVYLNKDGEEWVSCNRADGLAFDLLNKLGKPVFFISTEKNRVVTARAEKLKIQAIQGVDDKASALATLAKKQNFSLDRILYIGNDLNDYRAIQSCGYSACPADSHAKIQQLVTVILNSKGGEGVARELLEEVLSLDFIEILYKE